MQLALSRGIFMKLGLRLYKQRVNGSTIGNNKKVKKVKE
jgi:hypothetical protein